MTRVSILRGGTVPVVLVAMVTTLAVDWVDMLYRDPFTAEPDDPLAIRGCVIRFDERTASGDTRPTIHANGAHHCLGVGRVFADYQTGDLVVVHASDPFRAIVSIAVSPDETLVSRGIDCGASGGVRWTRIRCYDADGRVEPWSRRMYGDTSNLWVTWFSWAG